MTKKRQQDFVLSRLTAGTNSPGNGRVTREVIPQSHSNEVEESVIGEKFRQALQKRANRIVGPLIKNTDPWPDLIEDGGEISVELVRCRPQNRAEQVSIDRTIATKIAERLCHHEVDFRGLSVLLTSSKSERRDEPKIVASIADSLIDRRPQLAYLKLLGDDDFEIAGKTHEESMFRAHVTRRSVVAENLPGSIGLLTHTPFPFTALQEALADKLNKKYGKVEGEVWLLAYDLDSVVGSRPTENQLGESTRLFGAQSHPFDQVWYFFPYPGEPDGVLIQVWPVVEKYLENQLHEKTLGYSLEQIFVPIVPCAN